MAQILYPLLYIVLVVILARFNYYLITKGVKIKHAINGAIHLTVAISIGYFIRWELGLSTLILSRVVFDTSLNIFRRLGLGYIPLKPKSIVDKIENFFILKIASFSFCNTNDEDIEWTAIMFRALYLVVGIFLLLNN